MESITFEDLDQSQNMDGGKPFFKVVEDSSEEEIHVWLKKQLQQIKSQSWERLEGIRRNCLRYKGIQYLNQVYQSRDLPDAQKRYMPQIVVPLIRDAVDEKVARLVEFKPAVAVIPMHDEEKDKVDAKVAKRFLSNIEYTQGLDSKFTHWARTAYICGESFWITRWNPDLGPRSKVAGAPVFIGEVENIVTNPFHFYYELTPSNNWKEVNYGFFVEYVYTEVLKRDYPKSAGKLQSEKVGLEYFDIEVMEDVYATGMSAKITFWHKKTKELPNGYQACFTKDALLSKGDLPYTDDNFEWPVIRLVDGENIEETAGVSFIENVKGHAAQVSNFTNMLIKQQMLCAHPKWFVEAGSIDEQLLNNDVSIVKIKGGAAKPVLAQGNPISPQVVEIREGLKEEFYQMAKSNSVVQGQPPPGVTAFVALQYLSESENRRSSVGVQNFSTGVRRVYDNNLKICGQYYKKDDMRTMMIIGKDSQWTATKYDPASLAKPYAVMIQNTSALPESKSLRTQFILDMSQRFPNLFTQEQVLEMTGLAQAEKFEDLGSAAVRAAEDENEMILDGAQGIEPEPWEDMIQHWKSHTMAIQDTGFKLNTGPEARQAMINHITATEMMMAKQAEKNPSFAQILAQIPQWPMFFEHKSIKDTLMAAQAQQAQDMVMKKKVEDVKTLSQMPTIPQI